MNWFQKLLNNPNVHLIGALVAGVASIAYPPAASVLQIIAGSLVGTGILLPEQPQHAVLSAPASVTIPLATGAGSPHAADYVNALFPALGAPPVALPASGSLHGVDYVAIANALVSAFQNAGVLKPAAEPAKPA